MSEYVVLKQENIASISDLESYQYFIVHSISEFRIYRREDFMKEYSGFNDIVNLYCIDADEELRYNNRNWVKIFETPQKNGYENAFEILLREQKDFIAIKEGITGNIPVVVYKYFITPGIVTPGVGDKGALCLKDIPFIYRHGIKI